VQRTTRHAPHDHDDHHHHDDHDHDDHDDDNGVRGRERTL